MLRHCKDRMGKIKKRTPWSQHSIPILKADMRERKRRKNEGLIDLFAVPRTFIAFNKINLFFARIISLSSRIKWNQRRTSVFKNAIMQRGEGGNEREGAEKKKKKFRFDMRKGAYKKRRL